jgi:hypothetical protein
VCLADSPRLEDSPRLADSPRGAVDSSTDRLDRDAVFWLERTFVLRIVRACSSGQPAPPWRIVRGS